MERKNKILENRTNMLASLITKALACRVDRNSVKALIIANQSIAATLTEDDAALENADKIIRNALNEENIGTTRFSSAECEQVRAQLMDRLNQLSEEISQHVENDSEETAGAWAIDQQLILLCQIKKSQNF